MKCAPCGVSTTPSVISRLMRIDCGGPELHELVGVTICSTDMKRSRRGHAHEVVEVGIDAEVLAGAALVAAVHVDERDVEVERGHRHEHLAVGVRRT